MNHHHDNDMPDPEALKEVLAVVADKVPELLAKLSDLLYSPEAAKKYSQSIAIFYKELKEAGMAEGEAFELTKQYMSTLNIGSNIGQIVKEHHHD